MAGRNTKIAAVLIATAAIGCGTEEEIGTQVAGMQAGLGSHLRILGTADKTYATPDGVTCDRPKPQRFTCRVYVDVDKNTSIFTEYHVRGDCNQGWRARRVSDHPSHPFPKRIVRDEESDDLCS